MTSSTLDSAPQRSAQQQRPTSAEGTLPENASLATAAEQMFFHGAPLAHVVAYCEQLRLANISRRYMHLSRRVARRSSAGDSLLRRLDSSRSL